MHICASCYVDFHPAVSYLFGMSAVHDWVSVYYDCILYGYHGAILSGRGHPAEV